MTESVNYPERARGVIKNHLELEGRPLDQKDIFVVWFCYILGGWKALLSTIVEDNRYYEVTHNVAKNQTYVDTYVKESNVMFGDDSESKEK